MQFNDPDRPTIAHRPAYLSPTGKAIAPLPGILVVPENSYTCTITFWLLTSTNAASQYSKRIAMPELGQHTLSYWLDPEWCFREWFGYDWEPPAYGHRLIPKIQPTLVSLEDLGL